MGNQAESTLTNADDVYLGSARSPYYRMGKRGIELTHVVSKNMGTIDAADGDGILVAVAATTAITNFMTALATGALVSGGVATFDVGRAPSITATGDVSSTPLTFVGTDDLGRPITQKITGPTGNGTVNGTVAMKTVTLISCTGAPSLALTVGSSNVFNFPFRIPDKGAIIAVSADGKPETTLTTVAGLDTATTPTATTGDVRGTFTPNTSPNGTIAWNVSMIVDHTEDNLAFGSTPFEG